MWLSFVLAFCKCTTILKTLRFFCVCFDGLAGEGALRSTPVPECQENSQAPGVGRRCVRARRAGSGLQHRGGAGAARAGRAVFLVTCRVIPVCLCPSKGWEQVLRSSAFRLLLPASLPVLLPHEPLRLKADAVFKAVNVLTLVFKLKLLTRLQQHFHLCSLQRAACI